METPLEIGNRIKERREELGLSQEAVGARAGLFQEAVGRMERNKRNRAVEAWIRAARALETTVEDLYILPSKEKVASCQK